MRGRDLPADAVQRPTPTGLWKWRVERGLSSADRLGGAVRPLKDCALLTLDSAQAVEAARILGARRIVPVHFDRWAHFAEGREQLVDAFTTAGLIDRVELA